MAPRPQCTLLSPNGERSGEPLPRGVMSGRIDADGGMFGCLVRIGDPGELLDDTSARLGVESFMVPLLTHFEGS